MRTYRTKQGDMWDDIAYRLYPKVGKEMCMAVLLEANQEYRSVVVFSAGTMLVIPEIEVPLISNLPPWKRHKA